MPDTGERIPFQVDISRVIEVLAKQIYQSPLALLRENVQNAYDAVLLRQHTDPDFNARIDIDIAPDKIRVTDNGIGMTADDLRTHYWRAGSSSKNNAEARAAGVVGTFGIGAMANFGIAEELLIETEHYQTRQRTLSRARRDTLSATENCIDLIAQASTGAPGTTIVATVLPHHRVDIAQALRYITDFVSLLRVPVYVNGVLVSQRDILEIVSPVAEAWRLTGQIRVGPRLQAHVDVIGAPTGDMWVALKEMQWDGGGVSGRLILRQGVAALRTFRNSFGLAAINVSSVYQFGGVADLMFLEPTAGREGLTTSSMQVLQSMMVEIDDFCSESLASHPQSDSSTPFMTWVTKKKRYELGEHLKARIVPGDTITLRDLKAFTATSPILVYGGNDRSIIESHTSEDRPLLLLANSQPRRQCEAEFLRQFCQTEEVSDKPRTLELMDPRQWSLAQGGLAFRIAALLEADYFLKAALAFGTISHGLPLLVERMADGVQITLDPKGTTVALILSLYERDFVAFGGLVKDFVRSAIFPKVADLVPSSTRQGAEAFLKTIRKHREVFEYEAADLGDLPSIWQDVVEGKITVEQATERSMSIARASVQFVESYSASPITDVVPDVVDNEAAVGGLSDSTDLDAAPGISRLDKTTSAKLLVIDDAKPPLRGYRYFLAITDRVREENAAFFLQPHRTSVVWGGQRVLFVFQHHSGGFGLYYDLQSSQLVAAESGGGAFPTYTIVLQNAVFIPIPEAIRATFVPNPGERKRFEVRCDILYTTGGDRA